MNIEDIKLKFKFIEGEDIVYKLDSKVNEFYIIKDNGWYGVGVDIGLDKLEFYEKFENVKLITKMKYFSSKNHKLLELITNQTELREQFSLICFDFINEFDNEKINSEIIKKANNWWEEWKLLLGNVMQNEKDYDFLAELMVLNYIIDRNPDAKYSNFATHDIETKEFCVEVKSTIERYNSQIHINSQYQLENNGEKPLKLIFVRLEESLEGYSIKDLIDILSDKKYNVKGIKKLENIAFSSLNKKYKILEARLYNIDSKFPKITLEALKDEKMPAGIVKIEYIVDLNDIDYKSINLM